MCKKFTSFHINIIILKRGKNQTFVRFYEEKKRTNVVFCLFFEVRLTNESGMEGSSKRFRSLFINCQGTLFNTLLVKISMDLV